MTKESKKDELPDDLPQGIEEIRAQLAREQADERESTILSWSSFRDWLERQSALLTANPGLMEQVMQYGPALLGVLQRIFGLG